MITGRFRFQFIEMCGLHTNIKIRKKLDLKYKGKSVTESWAISLSHQLINHSADL